MVKRSLRAFIGVGTLALVSVAFPTSRGVEAADNQRYMPQESCCYSSLECPCVRTWCQADPNWACLSQNCPPRSQC